MEKIINCTDLLILFDFPFFSFQLKKILYICASIILFSVSSMCFVIKRERGLMLAFSLFLLAVSCHNLTSSTIGTAISNDSTSVDGAVVNLSVKAQEPVLLLSKWDSLKRNQISFVVDSIQPISIQDQKKMLKDSLIKEFDLKPKHIFLTFDDGPLVGSFAIDSLATVKQVKVSTFLVGRHANMSKARKADLERYKKNPLIACYNHSYSHAYNKFSHFYSDVQGSFADFIKNQHDLDLELKIARLPGRNIWIYDNVRKIDLNSGAQTADMLFEDGYRVYGWDVEWRINSLAGTPVQSIESVLYKIRSFFKNKNSQTPNNVVFLMHDDMFQTKKGRKLLADLIDTLKEESYSFEFMENYPVVY